MIEILNINSKLNQNVQITDFTIVTYRRFIHQGNFSKSEKLIFLYFV